MFPGQELVDHEHALCEPVGPRVVHEVAVVVPERHDATGFTAHDGPSAVHVPGKPGDVVFGGRPGLAQHALGDQGPAAAGAGFGQHHAVSGAFEYLHGGHADVGLAVVDEGVREEDDRRPITVIGASGAASGAALIEPLFEGNFGKLRQGPPPVHADRPFEDPLMPGMVHDPVAQRCEGGTEPVECFDAAEQAVAQGQPVLLIVVGEEFVLHLGHVDVGGTLALAALALQAEVEGFVDPPAREPFPVQPARQGGPEHVRAAPGAVLLVERGDIGRTHGPHQLLAAGADPVAELDGPREPAVAREIEISVDLLRLVSRAESQVVRHLLVRDDLARIHDAVRVEHGLDRLEGLVQPRAENLLIPFAAHESVAVLGTDRAAVGQDQVADFFGDGPHARDALGFLEIDERPDVDCAHAGMGVVGRHRAVLMDDIAEVADVVRKLLRRDRRVFHESRRLGIPLHAHQQPESRLPDGPGVRLGGRGRGPDAGVAQTLLPEQGFEGVQAARDLFGRFPVVLDHEDGFRVAVDEVPLMGGCGRGLGQVQDGLVGEFHGGGIGLQDLDRRFHGFDQVREMTDSEGLMGR